MSAARPSLDELKAVASIGELLARERRARLSAERRLISMQAELMRANAALDAHARHLAAQIRPLRREAEAMRGEAGRAEAEARTAERRLWDALEATPDGFAIYDAGLSLVVANARYLGLFEGLEEMAPGIGYRRVLELAAHEGLVDIGVLRPDAWVASMEGRLAVDRPEPVVLRLWDGTCVRVLHRRAASGDLVSLVIDVTATMEREADLEEARHRAEAASRAKSDFLANMSHELRTPLGGILGMSGLLAEDDLTQDQRVQVEVIQASGEALLAIVDDVLDLGRIEGARMALRPAPFEPRATIEEVVRMLRPTAMERGLSLDLDYDEGLPRRLVGDGGRVRQILTNLVGNAVKFTPSGHVTIRAVDAGAPAPGMVRLHVSVEDTGIGIAEADLERMFGAFEQAESDRDRHHDGAGLGLTVTHRLVELMGGEIWADSAPGSGSCFGIRLDLPAAGEPDPRSDPGRGCERERDGPPPTRAPPADARREPGQEPSPRGSPEAGPGAAQADPHGSDRPDGAGARSGLSARHRAPPTDAARGEPRASPGAAGAASAPRIGPPEADEARASDPDPTRPEPAPAAPAPPGGAPIFARGLEPAPDSGPPASAARPAEAPRPAAEPDRAPVGLAGPCGDSAAAPPDEPAGEADPEAGSGPRRMRVLAAEDNRANRLILQRMLAALDIALTFAEDGAEAVAAYGRERPDLILMDISMPGMDGREATRRIRAAEGGPRVPIVAMTAHALAGDEEAIRSAGLDGYLAKPLRKAQVQEVVLSHVPPGARPPDAAAAAAAG